MDLITHATGVPLTATGRADIEPIQFVGNAPERPILLPPSRHERGYLWRRPAGVIGLPSAVAGFFDPGVPELRPPSFRLGKGRFRPFGNHFALVLGHGRKNMNGEAVGSWHVAGNKIRAFSIRAEINATLRASRSRRAISNTAPRLRHSARAARSWGRLVCRRPLSISVNSATS